jgi:GTPase SAR1 family protein
MASNAVNEELIKILIYGSSGVGKTSLINLLTGSNERVGNGMEGCTFESKDILFTRNNKKYIITDTVGLNEAKEGAKVDPSKAILSLINLIKKAKAGFNLIIYVRKAGPLQIVDSNNYTLIIEDLFGNKTKTLCVITNAENYCTDDNLNEYWEKNQVQFNERMKFDDGVSGCCTQSSPNPRFSTVFRDLSLKTRDLVWKAIDRTKSDNPIGVEAGLKVVFIKIWNKIRSIASYLPIISKLLPEMIINKKLKHHLVNDCGVNEAEATEIARKIAEND